MRVRAPTYLACRARLAVDGGHADRPGCVLLSLPSHHRRDLWYAGMCVAPPPLGIVSREGHERVAVQTMCLSPSPWPHSSSLSLFLCWRFATSYASGWRRGRRPPTQKPYAASLPSSSPYSVRRVVARCAGGHTRPRPHTPLSDSFPRFLPLAARYDDRRRYTGERDCPLLRVERRRSAVARCRLAPVLAPASRSQCAHRRTASALRVRRWRQAPTAPAPRFVEQLTVRRRRVEPPPPPYSVYIIGISAVRMYIPLCKRRREGAVRKQPDTLTLRLAWRRWIGWLGSMQIFYCARATLVASSRRRRPPCCSWWPLRRWPQSSCCRTAWDRAFSLAKRSVQCCTGAHAQTDAVYSLLHARHPPPRCVTQHQEPQCNYYVREPPPPSPPRADAEGGGAAAAPQEEVSCLICMSPIDLTELHMETPCHHRFHSACLETVHSTACCARGHYGQPGR